MVQAKANSQLHFNKLSLKQNGSIRIDMILTHGIKTENKTVETLQTSSEAIIQWRLWPSSLITE